MKKPTTSASYTPPSTPGCRSVEANNDTISPAQINLGPDSPCHTGGLRCTPNTLRSTANTNLAIQQNASPYTPPKSPTPSYRFNIGIEGDGVPIPNVEFSFRCSGSSDAITPVKSSDTIPAVSVGDAAPSPNA